MGRRVRRPVRRGHQALAAIDIALWDLKAKRAALPLAKLLGAYRESVQTYNTSGGFLHAPIEEVKARASESLADGIGGIKIKVGQPDTRADLQRLAAVREHIGDGVPLMIDANQQWDRPTALRFGRAVEEFNLVWIEEPLDAYDAEGHAQLAAALDTPIATGEMLSSVAEHVRLIEARAADIIQPDAPRVGGITPSCGSPRSPTTRVSSSHPTSRWRSTSTSRRPTRASPGRALRVAQPALQRAPRDPRGPHGRARAPGPRLHPERAVQGMDGRLVRGRPGMSAARASSSADNRSGSSPLDPLLS